MKNFALIGAAGFVSPRHLKAIYDTHNILVAALDPHDSVGILDSYFPSAQFFTAPERFERFLERHRHAADDEHIHYVCICSPNYLHDSHIRMALRANADVLCEKPLVINPWNLDTLQEIEAETSHRVYTVLQLRLLPPLIELKGKLDASRGSSRADVVLSYVTRRGEWYHVSWKGAEEKSGGLAMNIGIHFFDLLIWLFGNVQHSELHLADAYRMAGLLELEHARVRWFLSVDYHDLPEQYIANKRYAFRSITILHTRVYENMLAGHGNGIANARPSIELVHQLRHSELVINPSNVHPMLRK